MLARVCEGGGYVCGEQLGVGDWEKKGESRSKVRIKRMLVNEREGHLPVQ